MRADYVVLGLAAAMVRPWCWYVLLSQLVFSLVGAALYVAFAPIDWPSRILVALITVPIVMLQGAYFYKRRAMFGATARWGRLERWCPILVGPVTPHPGSRPGFGGLSYPRRLFFLGVLLGVVVLFKVGPLERLPVALVILLALLYFIRRVRELDRR